MPIEDTLKDKIENIPTNPKIGIWLFGSEEFYERFNRILKEDLKNRVLELEKYYAIREIIYIESNRMVKEIYSVRVPKISSKIIALKILMTKKYRRELEKYVLIKPYIKSVEYRIKHSY